MDCSVCWCLGRSSKYDSALSFLSKLSHCSIATWLCMLMGGFMACPLQWLCLIHWLVSVSASWILVSQDGPTRTRHVAAWDSLFQLFLIHGGGDGEQQDVVPDHHAYYAVADFWYQNAEPDAPSARADHVVVWDPKERAMWIHAGFDGSHFLGDLWKYEITQSTWTLVADGTVFGPCARSNHVAAWDATREALWIHGGFDAKDLKSDLWRFESRAGPSGTWVLVDERTPAARAHHIAAWNDVTLWIHGGYDEDQRSLVQKLVECGGFPSFYKCAEIIIPHLPGDSL